MLLLVGLGNPTPGSQNNRHNVGFKVIDAINEKFSLSKTKESLKFLKKHSTDLSVLMLITEIDLDIIKSFRNIPNIRIDFINYSDPETMLSSDKVILTYNAYEIIKGQLNEKGN